MGGVSDLIYILLTLVCFAGFALLVGLLDRRLGSAVSADSADDSAAVSLPHDNPIPGAAR
jgi:hypothetical protein